jgi:predicted DNA-binding transcriptional regulator AlpA
MERPFINLNELSNLVGMTEQGVRNAITRGVFPIPTYKLGKNRVADKEVVRSYFANMRDIGLSKISTNK